MNCRRLSMCAGKHFAKGNMDIEAFKGIEWPAAMAIAVCAIAVAWIAVTFIKRM